MKLSLHMKYTLIVCGALLVTVLAFMGIVRSA